MTRTKTTSLYKLLFCSLVFHLLAIFAFWSEQPDTPLIAGKENAGETLSIALTPNTSPVNNSLINNSLINNPLINNPLINKTPVATIEKSLSTKTSPTTRHKDSNSQNILTSKSNTKTIVQEPTIPNGQHVAKIESGIAGKKKLREISTETAGLLQASLGEKLSEYFYYPRIARKRGWQGQVKLRLRIEGNGHLSNIQLHRSSGYLSLDNAALNSLQKAAYLPDAKSWLQGMHYDIVVPVEYHLIDS